MVYESSWEDKPLHAMGCYQEQSLSTRAIEAQIYHTRQDPSCMRWDATMSSAQEQSLSTIHTYIHTYT